MHLLLLAVVLCQPACAGLAPLYELGSAERVQRVPAEEHTAHGPQVDAGDIPNDPHSAYPGMGFGPMGPVRSALSNDATLRSLSSASGDNAVGQSKDSQLTARSADDAVVADAAAAIGGESSSSSASSSSSSHDELSPKPEYHIISVEFPRVETPFVIGIWIFFASIAKIGKWARGGGREAESDARNLRIYCSSFLAPRDIGMFRREETCKDIELLEAQCSRINATDFPLVNHSLQAPEMFKRKDVARSS